MDMLRNLNRRVSTIKTTPQKTWNNNKYHLKQYKLDETLRDFCHVTLTLMSNMFPFFRPSSKLMKSGIHTVMLVREVTLKADIMHMLIQLRGQERILYLKCVKNNFIQRSIIVERGVEQDAENYCANLHVTSLNSITAKHGLILSLSSFPTSPKLFCHQQNCHS